MLQKLAPKNKVYAVITGDIVGSTKLSPTEMKGVRAAIISIRETIKNFDAFNQFLDARNWVPGGVEFSQGDSWQIVLPNPNTSLRLALMIQAGLRYQVGAQTRMAIGMGTVDKLEKTAGISTGEAFTLSGRALGGISAQFRLTGNLPRRGGIATAWFPGLLHLCDALTRGWTKRQAEVISYWLEQPDQALATYEWVAARLNIAKQSVGDVLSSANLPPLRDALLRFEQTDWQSLLEPNKEKERAATLDAIERTSEGWQKRRSKGKSRDG